MSRFGQPDDYLANFMRKRLEDAPYKMTVEDNKKSQARIAWECEQDRLMIEQGQRIYGPFVIQKCPDSSLTYVFSYQGVAGPPKSTKAKDHLVGMFTGVQELIRRIDQWLADEGRPAVVDGPACE